MNVQANRRITCELLCESDSTHLQQLYAGFWMLREQRAIRLTQRLCRGKKSTDAYLEVVVDGSCRVGFDTRDSYEIDPATLARVDLYFKRGYSDAYVQSLSSREKVFPLGLNFVVYAGGFDRYLIKRALLQDRNLLKLRNVLLGLGLDRLIGNRLFVDRVDQVGLYPDTRLLPQVLYMTRVFDPVIAQSPRKREEIEGLNATRAQCIRLLRKEFGRSFTGGFVHDEYAAAKFKDCLIADPALATKQNYMRTLRSFPIGIATTGLHGSIGWKVAEYVAYGAAIVTEKLNYRVPGNFQAGSHYLEFITPEECVNAAARLIRDRELRVAMMIRNHRYYESHVRPDSLVRNSLALAQEAFARSELRQSECAAPLGQLA